MWARPFPWWQSGGPIIGAATGGRGRGGELKCGRELIERQSTVSTVLNGHCLSIRKQTLDRGEAKSSKLEVGIEDTMPTWTCNNNTLRLGPVPPAVTSI